MPVWPERLHVPALQQTPPAHVLRPLQAIVQALALQWMVPAQVRVAMHEIWAVPAEAEMPP